MPAEVQWRPMLQQDDDDADYSVAVAAAGPALLSSAAAAAAESMAEVPSGTGSHQSPPEFLLLSFVDSHNLQFSYEKFEIR